MVQIDIISDLHIDQWDKKYNIKYPCGEVIEKPFVFNKINKNSTILIICGDVSDDFHLSINYVRKLKKYYEKVIFVDGNHEHINCYPNLYKSSLFKMKFEELKDNNIIYLPYNELIIKDILFVGVSGWWDYYNSNIEKYYNYFDNWIDTISDISSNKLFIENVKYTSAKEVEYLEKTVEKYSNNDKVNKIIIITHTIPNLRFNDHEDPVVSRNSNYERIAKKYKKISHWIFGHTHVKFNEKYENIHYICNPLGRPEDLKSNEYFPITIDL